MSTFMPTRPLGRTGHQVGLFSLGGQGIIEQAHVADQAIAVVHRALELGVNYIDTANVESARRFAALSQADMRALEAKTQPVARQVLFFHHWAQSE